MMSNSPHMVRRLASVATVAAALTTSVAAAQPAPGSCDPVPGSWRRTLHAGPTTLQEVVAAAQPGDSIHLDSGDYGNVRLAGEFVGFVQIGAAPGQTPRLSSLEVRGSHWVIREFQIDGSSGPASAHQAPGASQYPSHPPLVRIFGGDNIVLSKLAVASVKGDYPWTAEALGVDLPRPLFDGIRADNTACLTVSQNHVFNVFNGMMLGGDQTGSRGRFYRVELNDIDDFAGDGIDHSIGDSVIYGNRITNGHDICDQKCVHTDGIQGWNYANRPGITNRNIIIDGNIIIQRTRPSLLMDNTSLQGITIFDGFWTNVRVTIFVVVTDVWHGITMSGVDGLLIANNTVVSVNERKTWIRAGDTTHQGGRGRYVVVRNNIATRIVRPAALVEHYEVDHNLEGVDPRSLFIKFDVANGKYDLHLRKGAPAIRQGSPAGAPAPDAFGVSRTTRVDIGAYQSRP